MAQQMRKFEQEAIASEILEKINSKTRVIQKDFEGSAAYKKMRIISDKIRQLDQEREDTIDKMNSLKKELRDKSEVFNTNNELSSNYKVTTNYEGILQWANDDWKIQRSVEQKLAIALLSPDWDDRLSQIIEEIANQF